MHEIGKRPCLSTAVLLVQQTILRPWWPYTERVNTGRIVVWTCGKTVPHTLPAPNQGLQPTPYSLRFCVAPAFRRG